MYEEYWKIERKPFEMGYDPGVYYPGEAHQGALLKLRYALESRRGAVLLTGPSGSGKTMLVGELRRHLPDDLTPFVHLVYPQMSSQELLAYLADELGAPSDDHPSGRVDESVRRIQGTLVDNARHGRHAVVVIDEAHLLTECNTLETIRLLLNLELDSRPILTLLLTGQPSILPALTRMPTLDERLAVKATLRPFTLEETVSYINHRLTAAGATRTILDAATLDAVHEQTQGNARQINRLCDLSLLVGYAEHRDTISADQIESICEELLAVAPA